MVDKAVVVVGHGMGGLLALKAAERMPISGLVLLSSELPRDLRVPARAHELREIPDVYGSDPSVLIRAPDFVAKIVGPPEVFNNPTVVLEGARKLAVRLIGGNPADLPGNVTFAIPNGETLTGIKQGDDVWVFDAAPRRAGMVRVQGKKSFTTAPVGPTDVRVDVARPE
jgi:pimeloyl-ACP methyl ester carboxylesterase